MFVNEHTQHNWYGTVRAFEPLSGKQVWEHKLFRPAWAGLGSTAGDLVFAGTSDGFSRHWTQAVVRKCGVSALVHQSRPALWSSR